VASNTLFTTSSTAISCRRGVRFLSDMDASGWIRRRELEQRAGQRRQTFRDFLYLVELKKIF
jgi:hypothetical protein